MCTDIYDDDDDVWCITLVAPMVMMVLMYADYGCGVGWCMSTYCVCRGCRISMMMTGYGICL